MSRQLNNYQKNQTILHQKLKREYLTKYGGEEEYCTKIDKKKYRFDIFSEQNAIIVEVQRNNFGKKFSTKIKEILNHYPNFLLIICIPLTCKQKILRYENDKIVSRSYLTRSKDIYPLFEKLVRIKFKFIPNQMVFDVFFVNTIVTKNCVGFRGKYKRRIFKTTQRKLSDIQEKVTFKKKEDFFTLLPDDLSEEFTNNDLFKLMKLDHYNYRRKRRIIECMSYSFWKLGLVERVGKKGHCIKYKKIID